MTKQAKTANRFWGDKSLPKSKAEFFDAVTMPAAAGGEETVATIRMYGPIDSWGGYWGISTKDMSQVLDALPDSVTQIVLRVNSPGGEVFEGVSILNMLRAHKAKVTAVVDGLAASAASVIAVGVEETVASPGTSMMIHSPSTFEWGNAADLRKTADVLDSIERSIIEVYEAKAGKKDWAALLAEETWYTANEAVTAGLADRVAVIPDAGETSTAGEEEPVIVVVPLEGIDDAARGTRIAAFSRTPKTPDSTEPGEPNRKEEAVAYSDLTAGLRERLGVTDADASDETLLAALDESLLEQANTTPAAPTAVLPDGVTVIDSAVLADLQQNARMGADARAEQDSARRDAIVATALREGRITSASRDAWRAQLNVNEEGTTTLLAALAKNTVPVEEIGNSDTIHSSESALYGAIYGTKEA